jgi:hypothetical protein
VKKTIERFIDSTKNDKNHRFKSWEHCYKVFENNNESKDLLALHLGFYLASWGMYRGSSGLLWKDYKVHYEAVDIIKKYYDLRHKFSANLPQKQDVLNVFNELSAYYSKLNYDNGKDKYPISATDTLISKIILGTLGCLPAFDRYFNLGLFGKEYSVINMKSIDLIWEKTVEMKPQIELVQEWINQQTGVWYPPLKILDMYYWQQGFDKIGTLKK